MLRRQPPLPPWLEALYTEMVKPPYFLQAKLQETKQSEPTSSQHDEEESTKTQADSQPTQHKADGDSHHKPSPSGHPTASKSSSQSSLYVPTPVLTRYPFEVRKKQHMDGILKIEADDNRQYAVKHAAIPAKRVRFLYRMLKYGTQQGFTSYPAFALSKKKSPVVIYDGNVYYATQWIDGQPANFASTEHVAQAAYALAQFHESTRGFQSESYEPESAFDLFQMTKQRNRDLHQLVYRIEAKKNRDAFDNLFVSLKEDLFNDAAESLQLLQQADCEAFLESDKGHPGLCHLDVIPNNCIYTPSHHVCLIDFELSTFAPRALDIAHLLRRSLERSNWNGDMAYASFLHFNTVRTIPKAEYRLVEALIRFPYQAWRVAHTRYRFFADEGQMDVLQRYANQSERRRTFLRDLTNQIDHLSIRQGE